MYTSLFDTVLFDSFFSPMRTVYVVSDSQLDQIKRKQRQEELKSLAPAEKKAALATEETEKCAVKT